MMSQKRLEQLVVLLLDMWSKTTQLLHDRRRVEVARGGCRGRGGYRGRGGGEASDTKQGQPR